MSRLSEGTFTTIGLIAKRNGSDRAIGLTSSLYTVYGKCVKGTVLDWRTSKAQYWDSCVKGSSCLRAGLLRMVKAEIDASRGLSVLAAFGLGDVELLEVERDVHWVLCLFSLSWPLFCSPLSVEGLSLCILFCTFPNQSA